MAVAFDGKMRERRAERLDFRDVCRSEHGLTATEMPADQLDA